METAPDQPGTQVQEAVEEHETVVRVRPATLEDVQVLKVILKRSKAESGESQFSTVNDGKLKSYIEACIKDAACMVAEFDGIIVGTICLRALSEIWSDTLFLNEEWWYVLPRYRDGTGAGLKLLDTAEKLADQMGLPVYMAVNTDDSDRPEAVIRHRSGYRYTGGNYLRQPNGKQEVIDNDDSRRS